MSKPEPKGGLADITPYTGGEAEIAGHDRVIKLSANESALGSSPQAVKAYREAADQLHRYPDGGCNALRTALAKRFGLDSARIVCGNGSDELIALLARAYAGPGDEVITSEYGFLYYTIAARTAGATPVTASETNCTANIDELINAVTPRTRLLFLANPNNPTGSYLPRDEMERLIAGVPGHVLIVLDAAYAEYVTEDDYAAGAEWVEAHDNVVMTRTFSKIFGLSALRLGWAYAPPHVANALNRLRGPFNVNGPAQAAATATLADTAFLEGAVAHNLHWRAWLTEKFSALGLTVYPSVANFLLVAFPSKNGRDAPAAEAFLKTRGILPRRVDGYGLPHCLRFTVGSEQDNEMLATALSDFRASWESAA